MMHGDIQPTDFGWLSVYGDDAGSVHGLSIGFQDRPSARQWLRDSGVAVTNTPAWEPVVEAIRAYLAGETFSLDDIPYAESDRLTEFQRTVRQVVSAIPYGQTRTYGEVAELAGRARAARAVGTVMASNHVPLLMPCHRVVPAGGKLGGFTGPGGIPLKQRLLDLERSAGCS